MKLRLLLIVMAVLGIFASAFAQVDPLEPPSAATWVTAATPIFTYLKDILVGMVPLVAAFMALFLGWHLVKRLVYGSAS